MCFPLFLISISICLGIEIWVKCIYNTILKLFKCFFGSCCCNACLLNILLTMIKTFSKTTRFGDLGQSFVTVLFMRCIAAHAKAEFWEGSPSCRNVQLHPLFASHWECQQLQNRLCVTFYFVDVNCHYMTVWEINAYQLTIWQFLVSWTGAYYITQ